MFGDFDEWSIVIFDNVLLLAHDAEDACQKLLTFLERCQKHNVFVMAWEAIECFYLSSGLGIL